MERIRNMILWLILVLQQQIDTILSPLCFVQMFPMWMYSSKFQTKFIQGHGHGYHMVSLFDNQLPGSWVLHPTNHSAPAGIACSVDPNQKSGLSCFGVLSTWVHLWNNKQSSILNSSQSGCRYISMYVNMSMWHVSIYCIPCNQSLALSSTFTPAFVTPGIT